ncbi:MAG: EamA/RhaT family transporter [Citrobacter freundii]|nr:MAG: EamA/RhaT family transporter [Citrobacter freundii]
MKEKNSLQGILLAMLAALIWSGNFIVARAVHKEISPAQLSFYRWATATILLAPFAVKTFIREWPLLKQHFSWLFWLSLMGISLFNTFVYVAGHHTSAINLALIGTTSSPIFANILARIFLKEKFSINKAIGMLICIAGVLLLLSNGNLNNLLKLRFSEGDAWVLLAALSFAIYNIFVRKRPAAISPLNMLFSSFLLGTLLLIPFFIWETSVNAPIVWDRQMMGVIFYLGLGASIISFLIWNKAIRLLGAGRTALFGNLIPVFSSLEAVFMLNEEFSAVHVISMVVVLAGLVVANVAGR